MQRQAYQDPQTLKRLFTKRLIGVSVVVALLTLVLIIRLFSLQIVEQKHYSTLSTNNSITLVPLAPPRGLIYDRNGVLLAENIPAFSLTIIPDHVSNLPEMITQLRTIINISPEDERVFYRELKRKRRFDEVPIKVKLSPQEVAVFSVNQYRYPGVQIQTTLIRHYIYPNDFVAAIGYVGRINDQDAQNLDSSAYAATNYIGKVGIERYFETELHGTTGYEQIETDVSGREIRILNKTPPIPGSDIYLTIDSKLQEAAIKALNGARGAVVVIQPSTGQVLAFVSSPSYDPNVFVAGISDKAYAALRDSPEQPLFNRAIRGQFPIASTIKVFIGLEAIDGNYVNPDDQIYDPGYFQLPNGKRKWNDWKQHDWVNFVKAIEVSCDTYFYQTSLKMGIDSIDKILGEFGFGQYTGIQMKEELPGIVASPAWKLKTLNERWYSGDTLNSSIGQGYMLTTPLQLASATATLAERGERFQPTLLLKSIAANGHVDEPASVALAPVEVSSKAWNYLIQGMSNVISGESGTAAYAFKKLGYTAAGKTGTAQVYSLKAGEKYNAKNIASNLRDNSMFIAFAPVEHPQIAIVVAVQNESTAKLIARKVMDYYLLTEGHLNEQ
jgi:penicillin-binding protein 2